jgi:hypothetical protein
MHVAYDLAFNGPGLVGLAESVGLVEASRASSVSRVSRVNRTEKRLGRGRRACEG